MADVVMGKLTFTPVKESMDLVAAPVRTALEKQYPHLIDDIYVTAIDPTLADTAEFCKFYEVGLDVSANTIVIEAKRGENRWHAMCNILANTRADINKTIRKHLDAKSASFASMDFAVETTGMEYGGIGVIGGPQDWPVLIDSRVLEPDYVIIGSGLRSSKIAVSGKTLAQLNAAVVLDGAATLIDNG